MQLMGIECTLVVMRIEFSVSLCHSVPVFTTKSQRCGQHTS